MDPHYRVAIFGSARIREGDRDYMDVFTIAKALAGSGFDIVSAGFGVRNFERYRMGFGVFKKKGAEG